MIFAGQRAEPFYVDLGSIFDLGGLRPFNMAHLIPLATSNGVDATKALNISTIAIQVPIKMLTANGKSPTGVTDPNAVIGVWTAASRRRAQVRHRDGSVSESGPWTQVSRLGMPLINEVIIPLGTKDDWNKDFAQNDAEYVPHYQHPELAGLLPVLYPGVFPNLAGLSATRDDLVAILLTGIPSGIIAGFQNFTGSTPADQLRLNTAIPPASEPEPVRPPRRRPGRLPERTEAPGRHRRGRAAGDRGCDLPARQQQVHAGRGRRSAHAGHPGPAHRRQRGPVHGDASRTSERRTTGTTRRRAERQCAGGGPSAAGAQPGGQMFHDHDRDHLHRQITTTAQTRCGRSPWCSTSATASGR